MQTTLSGTVKDVNSLLNDFCKYNTIIDSLTILSTKSYWNEDGTKVVKSDDAHLTILITYKPK